MDGILFEQGACNLVGLMTISAPLNAGVCIVDRCLWLCFTSFDSTFRWLCSRMASVASLAYFWPADVTIVCGS